VCYSVVANTEKNTSAATHQLPVSLSQDQMAILYTKNYRRYATFVRL